MTKDGLFGSVDEFYRSKQTNAVAMLLAERQTDILASLLRLCQEYHIAIPEGIDRSMGEVERLYERIALINSLPVHELLRLPPTVLKQPHRPTDHETEYAFISKTF
ncbi:MAG: hypothetical protein JRN28_03290 [Nitrososphaerota archaeon]|nr:hypothetical protein [Nitrososphaerota archaeon]